MPQISLSTICSCFSRLTCVLTALQPPATSPLSPWGCSAWTLCQLPLTWCLLCWSTWLSPLSQGHTLSFPVVTRPRCRASTGWHSQSVLGLYTEATGPRQSVKQGLWCSGDGEGDPEHPFLNPELTGFEPSPLFWGQLCGLGQSLSTLSPKYLMM